MYIATREYRQAVTNGNGPPTDVVSLDPRIEEEPRFTQAHKESMRKIIAHNPEATLIGFDKRMRPVVETTNQRRKVRYALMANGTAAVPDRLHESW